MATSKDYDPILAGDIVQAKDAKRKQTSFDATNSSQYLSRPPQPAAAAVPASAGPVGRATQQLASQAPRPILSLADAYPTAIGDGKSAIYAGVGRNGEASFSNAPSSLNTIDRNFVAPDVPQVQRMASLSDGWAGPQQAAAQPSHAAQPAGRRLNLADGYNPSAAPANTNTQPVNDLASLGTVRNMGDGVGTFSQASTGDAALSMTRFQRANDLRNAYRDQDRLDNAIARQVQDSHFTVVRDSSRKPTLADAFAMQERQQHTQNLRDDVQGAQDALNNRRQGLSTDRQERQALRLEDAFQLASSPNATPEQQTAYQRLIDPLNERGLKRQQAQADIDAKAARAERDRAQAARAGRNIRGLPAALQKLEDADVEAVGVTNTMSGALNKISSQISDGTLKLGLVDNATSAVRNAFGGSDETSANYASMLNTMEKLRNESLRLNKGVQTDGDAERAWNELFTNIRDPKIVQQRIKEINGYNAQAASIRGAMINNRRANQGLDNLDVDDLLGGGDGRPQQRNQEARGQVQSTGQPQAQQAAKPSPSQGPIYTISTEEQFARLPSGADFIDPQGNHRRKP